MKANHLINKTKVENTTHVVLVTGSSRGIGLAIAKKFALQKFKVVFNCLNNENLMNLIIDELRRYNPNIMGVVADVSNYDSVSDLFKKVNDTFGAVDILVNNASVEFFALFQGMYPDDWRKIIENNLFSVFNCSHLAIPDMVRNQHGIIINVSSAWGKTGASCEAVYAASKGGVNAFTKSLAKELAPAGIRVNAIACGAIDTDMNTRLSTEEKNDFIEKIPIARFGRPEEVAELTMFLASENSSYITGQIIGLDGGLL